MKRNKTACAVLGAAWVKLLFAKEQMEHLPWVCCAASPTNISHIPDSGHGVESTSCPDPVVDVAYY